MAACRKATAKCNPGMCALNGLGVVLQRLTSFQLQRAGTLDRQWRIRCPPSQSRPPQTRREHHHALGELRQSHFTCIQNKNICLQGQVCTRIPMITTRERTSWLPMLFRFDGGWLASGRISALIRFIKVQRSYEVQNSRARHIRSEP